MKEREYFLDQGCAATWVSDEKHLLSERAGHDVGVPATVDHILSGIVAGRFPQYNMIGATRARFIESYFFPLYQAYEVRDEHGINSLEGELKRFAASTSGEDPREVSLTLPLLDIYVITYSLSNDFREKARKKLNLEPQEFEIAA